MVERAHAWFAGFGKLRIRFERRLDIHAALLSLAAAVICSRFVVYLCQRLLDQPCPDIGFIASLIFRAHGIEAAERRS